MRRRLLKWVSLVLGVMALVVLAIGLIMGPDVSWQLLTHGPTTVWDHLEYPTRDLEPSPTPSPWAEAGETSVASLPGGESILTALETGESLAFVVVKDGVIVGEWYRSDHGPEVRSMLFSASKSIVSLLIGAAIDDGLIQSVADPVTEYVPEMAGGGFDRVTLEDLLRMDSSMDYVEDDNPLGIHIPFNFTRDLRSRILDLSVREEPDSAFRYKSGDNALLGLVLERALGGETLTEYLQNRLWGPLGAESPGSWNIDDEGGFERTWCCLAMTARDLARFGQLAVQSGVWNDRRLLSEAWLEASFTPGFTADRWPEDLSGSVLANYGYQWWLLDDGSPLALGKAGQYLYVDRDDRVVIVRLGESQGETSWATLIEELADAL